MKCVTFYLAYTLMGIDILDIREIIPNSRITQVQHAPKFLAGLMNLRGQILTVLDVGVLLGGEKCRIENDMHVMVFKNKDVGFVVDRIGDVINIKPGQLEHIPVNSDPEKNVFADQIIKLDNDIALLLNAKRILSYPFSPKNKDKEDV